MTQKIWKFGLAGGEGNMFFVGLPQKARALSVGCEAGRFVVWALFDVENEKNREMRWFHIAGTDHKIPDGVAGIPFLNRVDILDPGGLMLRFHAFDGGWKPEGES